MRAARIVPHILTAAILGWYTLAVPATAVEFAVAEGATRGFPAMRTLNGNTIADGDYVQWLEGGRLHVKIDYHFPDGRRI